MRARAAPLDGAAGPHDRVVYWSYSSSGVCCLKKPNYNAAKRARELKQKAKRDAKLARKQSRAGTGPAQPDAPPELTPAPYSTPPAEQDHDPLTHQGT